VGYLTCLRLYHDPARLFEPRRLLHFFLAYFLTVNLIRTRGMVRAFLVLFLVAVVLKAFEGVFLYAEGGGLQIKWRIRAIFTGWEDSLCFVTFLLLLAVFLLDQAPFPGKRLFLLLSPAVFFSLLFSYKRAYYVGMVVGGMVLFFLLGRRARRRFLVFALVAALIGAGLVTVAGQWTALALRIDSILHPTKESSASYRLVEWKNALISIRRHPWFGIGLGGVMPMEIWLSRTNLLGVHNTFLWVAVKMGGFGLFAYLWLHLAFWFHLRRLSRRVGDPFLRSLSRGLLCVFAAFCTAEMFAPMFAQMRTATWFGVILGLGMMIKEMDGTVGEDTDGRTETPLLLGNEFSRSKVHGSGSSSP